MATPIFLHENILAFWVHLIILSSTQILTSHKYEWQLEIIEYEENSKFIINLKLNIMDKVKHLWPTSF